MQGKRYAVFSRFSVHTARVTHLIKIFTFIGNTLYFVQKQMRKFLVLIQTKRYENERKKRKETALSAPIPKTASRSRGLRRPV